jgi:hypothetical protein
MTVPGICPVSATAIAVNIQYDEWGEETAGFSKGE